MTKTGCPRSSVVALVVALLGLLASARPGEAQTPTVSGEAFALQATVFGLSGPTTTGLASTGSLVDDGDARTAGLATGSIPSVGGANVLHATTISSIATWSPGDEIASEASLADLALTVAGSTISAGFVRAEADAPVGAVATGSSTVEGLAVNGVPILPTGDANQTISLPGLTLVLNEVQETASGSSVNALHISSSLDGLDVVVASATAGIGR